MLHKHSFYKLGNIFIVNSIVIMCSYDSSLRHIVSGKCTLLPKIRPIKQNIANTLKLQTPDHLETVDLTKTSGIFGPKGGMTILK